jgi:hypothetical protein
MESQLIQVVIRKGLRPNRKRERVITAIKAYRQNK